MTRTVFAKQWADMQGRLWTYPLVAFCFLLSAGNHGPVGLVFLVLAADLALQTAGDDARHGTFEFIFTRAIDRRAYLRTKYLFGLPILIAFVAFVGLLETVGARDAFWNLVRESVHPEVTAGFPPPGALLLAAAAGIFVFSLLFALITTTCTQSAFLVIGFVGLLVAAGYGAALYLLLSFLLRIQPGDFLTCVRSGSFVGLACAAFLVPSALLYLFSRELYARRPLPAVVDVREQDGNRSVVWVVLFVFVLVAVLSLLFLMLRVAPVPAG